MRGVGPVRQRRLAEAGFHTLEDLLFHLPLRYEDRGTLTRIAELAEEGAHTFRGRLSRLSRVRVRRRRLSLVQGRLDDGSGTLPVAWFNRPYLQRQVEEGAEYLLHGAVRRRGDGWQLLNPICERPERAQSASGVVAVYPALGGLGPTFFRRLVGQILDAPGLLDGLEEPLPRELRERHGLPHLADALRGLHRPGPEQDLEALNARRDPAHRRLAYGELLELQLELARRRGRWMRAAKPHRHDVGGAARRRLEDLLPFRLTAAQSRACDEIFADLGAERPMLRLLQGDVGSGKTAVAALALGLALESGLQGAFMAPTELLAEQHFRALGAILGGRYEIALLTGSRADLESSRRALAEGRVGLAVGTHALIQGAVEFERLGLAVIDEQHRFGVAQRRLLEGKGRRPDLLVMTATPIPRSLALTLYGAFDLSVLDELPPGRQPVETRVEPAGRRRQVYRWLEERLRDGDQAYVVLPLIEDSERLEAASIERLGDELRRRFEPFGARVLHGRTPADERQLIMEAFRDGRARALIATTVIEVGVDVPAATAMVIESSERFGLAQLHQLRGRVGRGTKPSVCVALHGRISAEGRRRLEVFGRTADGFEIAEADLAIRGPGDLAGLRQAGLPGFRVADLVRDRRWLERARRDAGEIWPRLGRSEYRALRRRLERRRRRGTAGEGR